MRQSGEKYISHPLNVAYILAEMQADADTICAGLLHDTLEDTNITKEYYVLFVITSIVILFWLYINSILWRLFIDKEGFIFGLIYNSFMIAIINMFLTPIIKQYKTCMDIEDNGKETEGIVYGTEYKGSNLRNSTVTYTIFKILVETKNGYRFVLYKMQNTNKKYKVNTKLKLKEHKGKYMLIGEITD